MTAHLIQPDRLGRPVCSCGRPPAEHPPDLAGQRAWVLPIGLANPPLQANHRAHFSVRSRWSRFLRAEVASWCRALRVPAAAATEHLHPPAATLHFVPPDRRRRDADNLVPTSKPAVDGLVDAGVLVDDTPGLVDHRMPVITQPGPPPRPGSRLYLLLEEALP